MPAVKQLSWLSGREQPGKGSHCRWLRVSCQKKEVSEPRGKRRLSCCTLLLNGAEDTPVLRPGRCWVPQNILLGTSFPFSISILRKWLWVWIRLTGWVTPHASHCLWSFYFQSKVRVAWCMRDIGSGSGSLEKAVEGDRGGHTKWPTCSISPKSGGAGQGSVSLHPHTREKVVPTGESVLLPPELELGELMETNPCLWTAFGNIW